MSLVNQWLANGCLGSGSGSGSGKHPAPTAPCVSPSKNSENQQPELETREAGFEAFWEEWPRRQEKAGAKRAWMKIPTAEYQPVMDGLKKWKTSEQWVRGVIPHASMWLKDKRWTDEDIPQTSLGRNSGLTADRLKEKRSQITPEGQAMLAKAGGLIQ